MSSRFPLVLWDLGGRVTAQVFASRQDAVKVTPVDDEVSRSCVYVDLAPDFDPARDYVVRVVSKNGAFAHELVAGTMPDWALDKAERRGHRPAGVGRVRIAGSAQVQEVLEAVRPSTWAHMEERRVRGIFSQTDAASLAAADPDVEPGQ